MTSYLYLSYRKKTSVALAFVLAAGYAPLRYDAYLRAASLQAWSSVNWRHFVLIILASLGIFLRFIAYADRGCLRHRRWQARIYADFFCSLLLQFASVGER